MVSSGFGLEGYRPRTRARGVVVTEPAPWLRAADFPDLGACWPVGEHRAMIEIACADESTARRAWREWNASLGDQPPDLWALRLLPLVARRLAALGIVTAGLGRLAGVHRHTWCTNQLRVRCALSALEVLRRVGVRVLALKGVALLATAYRQDLGLRGMLDIDILLRPEQLGPAVEALLSAGWKARHDAVLDDLCQGVTPWGENAFPLRKGDFEIDVHWHFSRLDRSSWLDARVWERAETALLAGVEVEVPSSTDLLLLIATHGACWTPSGPVLWPVDVCRLVAGGAVAWDCLVETTRERLLTLPLLAALTFARRLGVAVPESVIKELEATRISPAEQSEYRALTTPRHNAAFSDRLTAGRLGHWRSEHHGSLRELFPEGEA
jgi:hypothetical protein